MQAKRCNDCCAIESHDCCKHSVSLLSIGLSPCCDDSISQCTLQFLYKSTGFPEISNFFDFLYCRKRKHKKTAPVRNMVVRTGLSDIYLFLSEQGRKNSADDHRSCAYDQSADAKCDHNDSPFD